MRIYSFFSGLGFLDLGFEKSGFEVVSSNEVHAPFLEANQFARAGMGLPTGLHDMHCCSIDDLAKIRGWYPNKSTELTGFIGGPPCPDFSVAGKQKGREGDNGRLTESYVDLICEKKPDWFLFENVKGLWANKKHRLFYDEMVNKLIKHGYLIDDRLTNSIEYGAPQDRDRIILIGFKKKLFNKRSGGRLVSGLNWEGFTKYNKKEVMAVPWPTTDKFGGDPTLPEGCPVELTAEYWFNKNNVTAHPNYEHGFTPRAALPKFKVIEEGDDSRKSYKRLHRWRYSPTAAYGNNEVHLHPYEARRLRASEALALQSLPQGFTLPPEMTLSNMFKGIGNGVPYLAAYGLADMIKSTIEEL